MAEAFRLSDYLARIGFQGTARADLATLSAIHAAHVDAIPFEGLDPYLGREVKLDLASVQEKILDRRRGGYCFEQNAMLRAALEQIGFAVTGLAARVRWMALPDSPLGPRTHMVLRVDLPEGPFLADVGFGACLIDRPIPLVAGVEHRTDMGTFRLTGTAGLFALSARQRTAWRPAYVFTLEPAQQSDYELGNYFTSTSPRALFTGTLVMERLARDRRYRLIDRRFVTELRDGEPAAERELASAGELAQVLEEVFRITAPVPAAQIFARTQARVAAPGP